MLATSVRLQFPFQPSLRTYYNKVTHTPGDRVLLKWLRGYFLCPQLILPLQRQRQWPERFGRAEEVNYSRFPPA